MRAALHECDDDTVLLRILFGSDDDTAPEDADDADDADEDDDEEDGEDGEDAEKSEESA